LFVRARAAHFRETWPMHLLALIMPLLTVGTASFAPSMRGAERAMMPASYGAAARTADDREEVVRVVTDAYINGVHAKPSAAAMRAGFHPDFRMLVLSNGAMSAVTRDEWIARLEGASASAPKPKVTSELAVLDRTGSAATVRVQIYRDSVHTFTDHLLLYKFSAGWKIASKSFYAHPK
jgi:hypothetical protein